MAHWYNGHFRQTVFLAWVMLLGLDAALANREPLWRPYSADAFTEAREQGKPILLSIDAVWCHECQMMNIITYRQPGVVDLIRQRYIAVRADPDQRPDLAARYQAWGWPTTVLLSADGSEQVIRAGYLDAEDLRELLTTTLDKPGLKSAPRADIEGFSGDAKLSPSLKDQLSQRHQSLQDTQHGGLNVDRRFLHAGTVEWDLHLACQGDLDAERRARIQLDAATQLLDPAFGGAYQDAKSPDWSTPGHAKTIATQWRYMTIYAKACEQLGEERYCEVASSVADYLLDYLGAPGGAFFSSQDADLRPAKESDEYFSLPLDARLAQGMPKVNKTRYGDANGLAIEGLVRVYQATGQRYYLTRAIKAMDWVHQRRVYYGGGYRHQHRDAAGPYLSDTLYLGRAHLALFRATKEHKYLKYANSSARFIDRHFRLPEGGFLSSVDNGTPLAPVPGVELNVHTADFFLALAAASGNRDYRESAEHAMRYLSTEKVAMTPPTAPGILLISALMEMEFKGSDNSCIGKADGV
ncbi:MAG: DUF255 domain-containing protein [Gammaproteobacteria bacterium]